MNQKVAMAITALMMSVGCLANADYSDDLKLDQEVNSFYVAKDAPNTLVILIADTYGPRPSRYSVLSEADIAVVNALKLETPYNCKFSTKASVCASAAPDALGCGYPYYRYIINGLICSEAR